MFSIITKSETVKQQYSDDKNLAARMKLHNKHRTNKQEFNDWLWDQYDFSEGFHILELGCGNGVKWEGKIEKLSGCTVVFTDFSDGMVNIVREKFANYAFVSCMQMDIQNIVYPDASFDAVIANHMLYHVPNLTKALSEVRRVLKTEGTFYAATNGDKGMPYYLHQVFKHFDENTTAFKEQYSFTLQNGFEALNRHFSAVKMVEYKNSLSITDTGDLMGWIKSSIVMESHPESEIDQLYDYFEEIRIKKGTINIPLEVGIFISQN